MLDLTYRPWKAEEIDLLVEWANDRQLWECDDSTPYQAVSRESVRPWFEKRFLNNPHAFVVEHQHQIIGDVGIKSIDGDTGEFVVMIIPGLWRQGLGTQLMLWLENYARELGLKTLIGYVLLTNERAIAFYTKLGYTVGSEICRHNAYVKAEKTLTD